MSVGKIIQLVGVLVAIVVGLMGGGEEAFKYSSAVIAVLGVVGGWFIADDDRLRFLVAALALAMVSGALGSIPQIGEHISNALGSLSSLYNAAAVTVLLVGLVEKLKP